MVERRAQIQNTDREEALLLSLFPSLYSVRLGGDIC